MKGPALDESSLEHLLLAGGDVSTLASNSPFQLTIRIRGEPIDPVRIFIVDIKWPPETFLWCKIEGLANKGVDVTVFSTSIPLFAKSSHPNVRLRRVFGFGGNRFVSLASVVLAFVKALRYPKTLYSFWKQARTHQPGIKLKLAHFFRLLPFAGEKPDILHFEWNYSLANYKTLLELTDCPVVVSCRGRQIQVVPHIPAVRDRSIRRLSYGFQRATAVHCVSEAIKEEAVKFGLDAVKARVIRPAVDPDFFRPDSETKSNNPTTIISTGSLIWVKGYEYALQAIRNLLLKQYELRYQIIGDGPERQRLQYTIFDLELQDHVELLGKLPPTEVRDRLQKADIFLLSSLSEGISNAVLEAMACGLPIVTTDCGGMREAVTDGVEGYVVSVRDPLAMANALMKLMDDAELRARMGHAGRTRVLREFTLEQQIEQFVALYKDVIAVKDKR